MAAILRASSPGFDVDAFLLGCDWKIALLFHCGEKRRGREAHDSNGFNAVVSDAGVDNFGEQTLDAMRFLTAQRLKVRELTRLIGSDGVVLDFAVRLRDTITQSDVFSPQLAKAAGECGVALEISRYPISDFEPG